MDRDCATTPFQEICRVHLTTLCNLDARLSCYWALRQRLTAIAYLFYPMAKILGGA